MSEDWSAVAKAIDGRLGELGWRQRELAERAQVSQAIVRELQHNTAQRRRSARTLEALSAALGWRPGHLSAVLAGGSLPAHNEAALPADAVVTRLSSIDDRLRAVEDRLTELVTRLAGDDDARTSG